jgi:AAA+ ATPase superfamily predicted ATPase
MQGLVLDRNAPLFGRARELIELGPLPPRFIREAFGGLTAAGAVEHFAAWGGVPRYWELATEVKGGVLERLEALALDPLGPLHRDPDLLLLEEIPSALEVRPVLDAIGGGAHRVSEIAGRLGRPATSLSRPLDRLVDMRLVAREIPFGEPARSSKRSLYRIDDPFFRFWFRVVAPNRSRLTASGRADRRRLLAQAWPALAAAAWEDLCRRAVPLVKSGPLGRAGPWSPAQRWWQGNQPEWDVVASSVEGDRLLLGEVKWRDAALSAQQTGALAQALAARQAPPLANDPRWRQVLRVLFVPLIRGKPSLPPGVVVCTADAVLAA